MRTFFHMLSLNNQFILDGRKLSVGKMKEKKKHHLEAFLGFTFN